MQVAVPRAGGQGSSVRRDSEARHTVVVAIERLAALSRERVPHVAAKVIISREEVAARHRKGHARDSAQNVLVRVRLQLAVRANIKQAARRVVGTRSERVTRREEGHGVNVRVVASKRLLALALGAAIPQLGRSVASTGDENIRPKKRKEKVREGLKQSRVSVPVPVGGRQADGHDVSIVVGKFLHLGVALNIPQNTGHIAGARDNLRVAHKAAAAEVTSVSVKLALHLDRAVERERVKIGKDERLMWPSSSHLSLVRRLYTEQMLSRPPHATRLPEGLYAHVMTQDERSGIACSLFVVRASQTSSLPSCEADTRLLLQRRVFRGEKEGKEKRRQHHDYLSSDQCMA